MTGIPELWFQSNIITTDLVTMFTTGASQWANVREKISAFSFFRQNLRDSVWMAAHPIMGPQPIRNTFEELRDAGVFAQLAAWKIPVGVEASTAYAYPDDGLGVDEMMTICDNMAALGCPIRFLNFDTPHHWIQEAGATEDQAADVYANIVAQFRVYDPTLQFGEFESIFNTGDATFQGTWITKCRDRGCFIDWFQADVGWHMGQPIIDELKTFIAWAKALTPPLVTGITIDPGQQVSLEPDDGTYVIQAHESALVGAAVNIPAADLKNLLVESWYLRNIAGTPADIPINLPEDNAWGSHTWLAAECARVFSIPDRPDPVNPLEIDYIGEPALVGTYLGPGGALRSTGTVLGLATAAGGPPVTTYPLLTRQDRLAWRGSWRGGMRGGH